MIDNSMVAFGKSTLKVSNSSVLRGNYTCIVHYENGSQQENKTVPPVEGQWVGVGGYNILLYVEVARPEVLLEWIGIPEMSNVSTH